MPTCKRQFMANCHQRGLYSAGSGRCSGADASSPIPWAAAIPFRIASTSIPTCASLASRASRGLNAAAQLTTVATTIVHAMMRILNSPQAAPCRRASAQTTKQTLSSSHPMPSVCVALGIPWRSVESLIGDHPVVAAGRAAHPIPRYRANDLPAPAARPGSKYPISGIATCLDARNADLGITAASPSSATAKRNAIKGRQTSSTRLQSAHKNRCHTPAPVLP